MPPKALVLHHLPNRKDNLLYIIFAALAPIINLIISGYIFDVSSKLTATHLETHRQHWIFAFSDFLLEGIGLLIIINLVINAFHRSHEMRKTLAILGILSTLDLAINMTTLVYGIYQFKIESYVLLLISGGLYLSLNLVFVFWYWYIDYPTQIRRLRHPELLSEIGFPMEPSPKRDHWVPQPVDYLYFTIMTSNTLGPPENHTPYGNRIKYLQMIHSSLMLILLVLFVSRAVNTLA